MSPRPALRATWYLFAWSLTVAGAPAAEPTDRLSIEPPDTVLDGRRSSAQLIATGHYDDGTLRDLTHEGRWTSSDPAILTVHPGGRIEPRGDGQAEVRVASGRARWRQWSRSATPGRRIPSRSSTRSCPR